MKKLVILFAGEKPGFRYERKFDSLCAFEKTLEWAFSVEDSIKTVIFTNKENFPFISECLPQKKEILLVQHEVWTNALVAKEIASQCAQNSADFAVFAWADSPFLNKELTDELISSHVQYKAEYTFADGFASGFAPEVIDRGAASIIASLAENLQKSIGEKPASRDALFSIMSSDINSFEIETVISDKDYRMLRYNFECSSKSGFTSCVRLFEEAKTQKKDFLTPDFNVYEISDLAEKMLEIQQTLPAYYNVQISNSYNTKSLYCPYEKLFSGKKMPFMQLDEFKILVKKIADFSAQATVGLSLFGEPTLNPEFVDFALEVLKYPELKLFIETDGLCFSEEQAKKIAEASKNSGRVDFAVQFDSVDEKMYEKMNGISGSNFQKALKTVAMLSQIFPSHVYPQFTRMNANEEQLESFYRFWKEKTSPSGGQFVILKYDSCAGLLSDEKPADLSPLERNVCWHLRRDMNILSDGSVPLCRSRISEIAGNAIEEPFEKIWDSVQKEVLNHMNKNYCEKCQVCDEYYTFNF